MKTLYFQWKKFLACVDLHVVTAWRNNNSFCYVSLGPTTFICVGKLTIVGSVDCLSPGRRHDIMWTNAEILLIGCLGLYYSRNFIAIKKIALKKMCSFEHVVCEMLSISSRPHCDISLTIQLCELYEKTSPDCWGFTTHIWGPSRVPEVQYIPRNMHTFFALLCFVVVIHWLIFPYPSGLLHWHCGNLTIASVPAKQPWWIWINTSFEFIMNDYITTTKQSTTKPCAYFLGYTVCGPSRVPEVCNKVDDK